MKPFGVILQMRIRNCCHAGGGRSEETHDDAIVHCRTEAEAQKVRGAIAARMEECGLELHPEKTKVVYCKDGNKRRNYPNEKFDFLGYGFSREE